MRHGTGPANLTMIVHIAGEGAVTLREAEDFRRLSVSAADTGVARSSLAGFGRLEGPDHVWIAPDRLRGLAGIVSAGWDDGFAGMLAYAAGKGWTDAGGAVRVHIEFH